MKTFIFSLILFFIIILVIIFNSLYVQGFCKNINEIADSKYESDSEKAELLCNEWLSHRSVLTFSVHEEDVEQMDELMQGLKSAVTYGDRAETKKYLFLIKELIETFQKDEKISLQGIG